MNTNENTINSFASTLRNHHPQRTFSLYGENKNKGSGQQTYEVKDVIIGVVNQLKAIQNADSVITRSNVRSIPNTVKKLKFLPIRMVSVEQPQKQIQSHKFETQCVLDTQLIDIIENAEAIIDAEKGITQEFDTTFCQKDLDKFNNKPVDEEVSNIKNDIENNNSNKENKSSQPENNERNDVLSYIPTLFDDIKWADNNGEYGITQEFEKTFCNKNQDDNVENKMYATLIKNNNHEEDLIEKTDHANTSKAEMEYLESKNEQHNPYIGNKCDTLQEKSVINPTINNLSSTHGECDKIDLQSSVYFDTYEDDNNNYSSHGMVNSSNTEAPKSPILNKIHKNKSNTPSPIIFRLESFEKFESIALPIIENYDFETAKKVINSQIYDKELFIHTNAPCTVLHDRDKDKQKKSPVLKFEYSEKQTINQITMKEDIDLEELPSTCALLDNKSEILGELTYVGFQTASNKSIQVYSGSYNKAKTIFDNIDTEYVPETKLVSNMDSDTKMNTNRRVLVNFNNTTNTNKEIKICFDNPNLIQDANNVYNNEDTIKNSSKMHQKDVLQLPNIAKVNDEKYENLTEYLQIDNHILEEFDIDLVTNTNLQTAKSDQDDVTRCGTKLINVVAKEPVLNMKASNNNFVGFRTANNKMIKISAHALEKSKRIFDDIDNNDTLQHKHDSFEDLDYLRKTRNCSEDFHSIKSALNEKNQSFSLKDEQYVSKTVDKNALKLSKTGAFQIKKGLDKNGCDKENKENETQNNNETSISFEMDTKDSRRNIINQSKPTLKKPFNFPCDEVSNAFKGFTTASNKPIGISESALAKTKTLFYDIYTNAEISDSVVKIPSCDTKVEPRKDFQGCATASNKPVAISENALTRSQKVFQDIDNNEELSDVVNIRTYHAKSEPSKVFQGFTTANNKPVIISESALAKTNKLFHDIVVNEEPCDVLRIPACNTQEGLGKLFQGFPTASNQGFATASNKPVIVSESALAKTKKIFHDIVVSNESCDNHSIPACDTKEELGKAFQGFSTASNQPVAVSKDTLAKTKKLFQNIDVNEEICDNDFRVPAFDLKVEHNKAFRGFKTASNKSVNISESALVRSKILLHDIENNEELSDTIIKIPGFNTKVERGKTFQGFSTASNKPVAISDSALAKTKKIFQNIDVNEEICDNDFRIPANDSKVKPFNSFQSFTTASNKPVKICKSALAKSKKIFRDIDTEIIEDIKEDIFKTPFCKRDTNSCSQRLKTANNKAIPLSEKHLEKYRDIFRDINIEHKDVKDTCDDFDNLPEGKQPYRFENPDSQNFVTAGSKPLKISENAPAKSEKIFESMDIDFKNKQTGEYIKNQMQTANNSPINISEEALNKCRNLFNDFDESLIANTDSKLNLDGITSENGILEDFNTEIIKDFEETFCTEDFVKKNEITKSKRSGSPILLCPKAKKQKKIETPFITKKFVAPIKIKPTIIADPINKYKFSDDYKKNKKYILKEINEIEKLADIKYIDPYVLNFKLDTLLNFEFKGNRNDVDNDTDIWPTDKIKRLFENSVNKRIIPDGWMYNHLKLIIWKLICYEIRFPDVMKNICTIRNVLEQLKYRYKRELYNVERPALRKILERDEVSTRRMILCVAGLSAEGAELISVPNDIQNVELLLTDGWYCVKATTDRMIARLVCEGKIGVGTKLVIHGAELANCDQGIAPWEDTSLVRLKISGNSTRRARWDARLGFHGNGAILTRLSSVKPEGGRISHLRVLVTRVYPTLYIEKFPDGSTLTRSERLENNYQMKYETERQNQLEKLYDELERFSDQESQDSEGQCADDRAMDSGSQISRLMKRSRDREEFRANLTSTQACLLQQHSLKQKEKLVQALQSKFTELVKKRGLDTPRNVVPLVKIRAAEVETTGVSKAMITIWKPSETIQDMLAEGTWLDVYNVVPTSVRYSEIQISAGRQSVFQRSKLKETDKLKILAQSLKRQCYTIKNLQNPSINTDYNEVDTVGIIFMIEPNTIEFEMKNQPFQNVYLADEDKNIICVNFWGGIKKFGFQNILEVKQVVACINLQKRAGNTKRNIPQYRATEFSYFTKMSKMDSIRKMADSLASKFNSLDKRKFIHDCVALKNNFHSIKCGNTSHISPYRLNISDYNVYKNKAFIDSPLVKCTDINLNLSGLDFESTFKQADTQDLSPQALLRKRKVNEKIAKLKMYGEPPPLSTIHIINKSSDAEKAFKSPFAKNDISASVANPNVLPGNVEEVSSNLDCNINNDTNTLRPNKVVHKIDSSPILNRTHVKRASINPVKLNFSNAIDTSTKDPFAEDFEGSPPLSLDVNFLT
ncbi:breast cancer type 2 susceptibility protein homolog [Bicyclus anynana]|uniref:Breast cancer type 2 susceptibility protein homolog n=1 Tax=Bicyclus anynana TaxID=110368 RepID=A0A6J1NMK6_BICAN|nr:breast cancer type 2 susceptibility protein homolog [Bicyclus anynana]